MLLLDLYPPLVRSRLSHLCPPCFRYSQWVRAVRNLLEGRSLRFHPSVLSVRWGLYCRRARSVRYLQQGLWHRLRQLPL